LGDFFLLIVGDLLCECGVSGVCVAY
jgi:hypothetical protein